MKLDFSKIKKITIIKIAIILIVAIGFGIYFSPFLTKKREDALAQQIKSNNKIFTQKILDEFAQNKNIKASSVAEKIIDELNPISKNPYNKKMKAYTFDTDCKACSKIEYSDELTIVVISTYDRKGELSARTVIKPPSFVSYYKSDNE